MDKNIKVYHGTYLTLQNPDLQHASNDVDFGPGFYLTEDINMASEWAAHKTPAIVNHYSFDIANLKICHLKLDETWLNYVAKNRGFIKTTFNDKDFDIIIGPTADNKVHLALTNYVSGKCTAEEALSHINGRQIHEQIVIKSEKALKQLEFVDITALSQEEIEICIEREKTSQKAAAKFIIKHRENARSINFPEHINLNGYEERS